MKTRIRSLIAKAPPRRKWRYVSGSWRIAVGGVTATVECGSVVCYRVGKTIAGVARTVGQAKRVCEEHLRWMEAEL